MFRFLTLHIYVCTTIDYRGLLKRLNQKRGSTKSNNQIRENVFWSNLLKDQSKIWHFYKTKFLILSGKNPIPFWWEITNQCYQLSHCPLEIRNSNQMSPVHSKHYLWFSFILTFSIFCTYFTDENSIYYPLQENCWQHFDNSNG